MMLTRCPGCTTTFRVTPEQVKARHGKVRCGRCQHVFDAIEFLVDAMPVAAAQEAGAPATAVAISPDTAPDGAATESTAASPASAHADSIDTATLAAEAPAVVVAPAETADADADATPDTATDTNAAPSAAASEMPAAPAEPAAAHEDSQDPLLQPSPLSAAYAQARALRVPRWPWTVAALLALLALLAQLAIAYRTELATRQPSLRPWLEMLCAQAHCTVGLPSNPDLVGIEASDLHPSAQGGLELTATLRNRAPYAQGWPDLELTLTDGADKPIVRKVIAPAQYLPATLSAEDGFAANTDVALQLQLDAGTLPAAGYRLYLFYP